MKQLFTLETDYRTTISSILWTTREGRVLWATGGPIFPQKGLFSAYRAEIRQSDDNGLTWSEPRLLLQSTSDYAWIPNAGITLTTGRLLLLSGQFGGYVDHDPDQSRMEGYSQFSDDGGKTWSQALKLPTGERYLAPPLSMTQISTGRVIYPYGYLTKDQGKSLVTVVFSDDEGASWQRSTSTLGVGGKGMESGALEPSVIELPDGRIWMLIRAQTGFQWESFSCDRGATWSLPVPSKIPSSNSPAVLLRLSNGTILLIWNNCVSSVYARPSLMIAATNDGKTFYGFREIDHTGYPMVSTANQWGAMYPYVMETSDGNILVAFNYGDWTYLHAKLARINLGWLEEKVINYDIGQYGLGDWCTVGVSDPVSSLVLVPGKDKLGFSLQVNQKEGLAGAVHDFPLLTEGQIHLTLNVINPQAVVLWHNTFPYPGKVDEACLRLRCTNDGTIFIGTGTPEIREELQSNLNQSPIYSYLAYPVKTEISYPQKISLGTPFDITIACNLSNMQISVSINRGPEVSLPLSDILGLCYFGIAGVDGGSVIVSKLIWDAG